jgi:pimeloyl-ACP methyl ester carboxylesterase
MTVVLVHGVPETTAVWDPLVAALDRDDLATLALPGFGCALPEGFEPTQEHYAQWLATELDRFEVVDLVGHDWGALLALRLLPDRPANVRSWVLDAGDLDPTFRWHDMALLWQTPGEGEAFMEGFIGASTEDRAALLASTGVPESGAVAMAAGIDRTMGEAILTLYRSATTIGQDWGPGIDRIEGPGLLLESMQDPFRSAGRVRQLAERTGAEILPLPEAGHWWMLDSVEAAAAGLQAYWARLDA